MSSCFGLVCLAQNSDSELRITGLISEFAAVFAAADCTPHAHTHRMCNEGLLLMTEQHAACHMDCSIPRRSNCQKHIEQHVTPSLPNEECLSQIFTTDIYKSEDMLGTQNYLCMRYPSQSPSGSDWSHTTHNTQALHPDA